MKSTSQRWEYLFVETMFVMGPQKPQELSNQVMFFDHYAKVYGGQKSDLEDYFAKLRADGWEQTMGPWSYPNPAKQTGEAARLPHPRLPHLSWLFQAPGRKLYQFKRLARH